MRKLCPNLNSCMREVVSKEEDAELGRCIQQHLGLHCTNAYEVSFVQWLDDWLRSSSLEDGHASVIQTSTTVGLEIFVSEKFRYFSE